MGSGVGDFQQAIALHRRITVDTVCCIYFIERKAAAFLGCADHVFAMARRGGLTVELPAIARLELMVHPLESRDPLEMDRVRKFIERSPGVEHADVSEEVLLAAASVRAATRLRAPDALVVASAAVNGSGAIVGNDKAFASMRGLQAITVWGAGRSYRMPEYIHIDDYLD